MLQLNGLKLKGFKDLIQASGILFLASVFANICNLLFWLFMVRRLTPIEYGILNALFSLFMILSLPASTIQAIVTKFVAESFGNKEFTRIKCFVFSFGKGVLTAGILFLLTFILFSQAIGDFLRISSVSLIIMTGIILFFSFVAPLPFGILQGSQKFLAMSVNGIFGSLLKLILGIILVGLGFKVKGALIGFGLSAFLALVLSFFQMPKVILTATRDCAVPIRMNSAYRYSLPVFLSLLSWVVLTNGDVILVKHFFSPENAGFYSVAQMVGKVVLFLPGVVGVVLFPKMCEAFSTRQPVSPLLKKGLAITGFLSLSASIFCGLFPGFVLKALTRKEAVEAVRLVPFFCIAMTFYALINLFVFYNLSIHRLRFTIYLLLAGLLQLTFISLFHPSLLAVVYLLIIISVSLFLVGALDMAVNKERT